MNQTAIPVTIPSVTHKGKFFVLRPSFWGNGQSSGLEIANKKRLRLPGTFMIEPPNGDPNQYPEKPHLIHVPELGGMPRDFEKLAGQWIVSEALKHVFEAVDPQGLAFSACDFTLADGSPGLNIIFAVCCGRLTRSMRLSHGSRSSTNGTIKLERTLSSTALPVARAWFSSKKSLAMAISSASPGSGSTLFATGP
ncbi:DUF1629 domain-containing protein [Xanthomonas hortorum pv. pelargonii]|nr:DUF1629 domain-containing protein [Xanthomonas hortorum]UUF00662.1 DUF1629 domain-containing protein [Xanthomonas hortorum pv. pelargonii]UXN00468.1 DUF1629 domain-containing protein [Xanthomonas hortorum pv. pelargonii]